MSRRMLHDLQTTTAVAMLRRRVLKAYHTKAARAHMKQLQSYSNVCLLVTPVGFRAAALIQFHGRVGAVTSLCRHSCTYFEGRPLEVMRAHGTRELSIWEPPSSQCAYETRWRQRVARSRLQISPGVMKVPMSGEETQDRSLYRPCLRGCANVSLHTRRDAATIGQGEIPNFVRRDVSVNARRGKARPDEDQGFYRRCLEECASSSRSCKLGSGPHNS